jgi:D-arabinose 1-dehydrogenase-like Zn-dependent alcohol dehydrogenase
MLVTRANIQPGQTVLIMGGGSGMGIAGIQIAKLFGVIALLQLLQIFDHHSKDQRIANTGQCA